MTASDRYSPPKRILIIDDEAPLRRVMQLTLKITAGWEALVAGSGVEGLQQAEVEQPDAILLDLMMPQMNGIAILAKLQENPATQKIPVVLLTANVQAAEQPFYRQLGAAAVLIKPFDPSNLVAQIKNALSWN